ncbi:hypothetical protein V1511DRAFT_488070 [Dipodascopsis uninucleata]
MAKETGVLESAKFIYENSEDVRISKEGCEEAANVIYDAIEAEYYSTETWSNHLLNPKEKNGSTIDWIFLVDLLNFSFWSDYDLKDTGKSDTKRYSVKWDGHNWTGYWSLCALVNRALAEGIPITSPSFWVDQEKCTDELLCYVFRSNNLEKIPMEKERISCIREAGEVLTKKFGGSFKNCIERANNSAVELVTIIVENFPCFRDENEYKGRIVKFYKRAQILVSDVWACFNQESYGKFYDIDKISMFADYRVPQILYNIGCLQYSERLKSHLLSLKLIEHGHPWEIELRGCSIWCVEILKSKILEKHPKSHINSVLIDFYLWDTAKKNQQQSKSGHDSSIPCHRTRSVFY